MPTDHWITSLPDKVFLWNGQGIYVGYYFPNQQNKHFVGPQQFMGRHILEVLPNDAGECVWEAVRLTNKSKGTHTLLSYCSKESPTKWK